MIIRNIKIRRQQKRERKRLRVKGEQIKKYVSPLTPFLSAILKKLTFFNYFLKRNLKKQKTKKKNILTTFTTSVEIKR